MEDGLQLWLVALRNAPWPDSGLLSLFPNLAAVMQQSTGNLCRNAVLYYDQSTGSVTHVSQQAMLRQLTDIIVAAEHVQIGCQIITSCVLLGKAAFLQQYGGAVLHSLQAMIGKFARLLSTKTCCSQRFKPFYLHTWSA